MRNKTTILIIFVSFLVFVQLAVQPVCALNSPAISKDGQLPKVVITSPEAGSKHNYIPAFSGTVINASSTGDNGQRFEPSSVGEIKLSIAAEGKIWNGREWVKLEYSEDQFLLPAAVSGENWTLSDNLPVVPRFSDSEPKTTVKNYTISVQATDNAGNKSLPTQISIRIEPLELMIFDANRQFIGVDLSGNTGISTAESAKLAGLVSFDNLNTGKGTSPADINALINSFGEQMLNLYSRYRLYAVADGATKLLVVAKGYSPGKVEFHSSPNSEFASICNIAADDSEMKLNSDSPNPEINNPQMSAAVDRMYAAIKRQLKKYSQICATGTISGDNFVVLDSYQKSENEFYWFGVYTVPPDVAPNLPNTFLGQAISLEAVFTPDASTRNSQPQPAAAAPLFLKRPPVLLVHGLNDKASSWDTAHNSILEDNGFDVRLLDYRNTNGKSFQTNRLVLLSDDSEYDDPVIVNGAETEESVHIKSEGIKQILADYRRQGIAISKVDVVAHSMGGNLARVFDAQPENRSDTDFNYDNFNQGYIHRLITIGTPHLGSNVANILTEEMRVHGIASCGSLAFSYAGGEEASVDLSIGSATLLHTGRTSIPSHAIYAVASNDTVTGEYHKRYLAAKTCIMVRPIQGMLPLGKVNDPPRQAAFIKSLCAGVPCDWTVSVMSQQGGLTAPYTSTIPENTNHGEETSSITIRERVRDLLMGGAENFAPEGFPAVASREQPPNSLCMFPERTDCANRRAATSIVTQNISTRKSVIAARSNQPVKLPKADVLSAQQDAILRKMSPVQRTQIEKLARDSINQIQQNTQIPQAQIENTAIQSPKYRVFSGGSLFQMKVPETWRENILSSLSITFAPENGKDADGGIIRGLTVEATRDTWQSIEQAREALIQAAVSKKPFLHVESPTAGLISNHRAYFVKLTGQSAPGAPPESVIFAMTLLKDGNLFYAAMFFPEQESAEYKAIFTQIVDSIEIND